MATDLPIRLRYASYGQAQVPVDRTDLSCGRARVEGALTDTPILFTGTGTADPGAYVGGGVGNKAIMGCHGHDGLLLSRIKTISFSWTLLHLGPPTLNDQYMNFIVDLDGNPANYRVFDLAPRESALNVGTFTVRGPRAFTFSHDTQANYIQVVGAFTPAGPFPGNNPAPTVVRPGVSWQNLSFSWPSILAVYPNAKLIDTLAFDGGFPLGATVPSVVLVAGDSANVLQRYVRSDQFLLNGTLA